jgi:hypothetical protein
VDTKHLYHMNLVQSAADYSGWFIQVKHIILIDKKEKRDTE